MPYLYKLNRVREDEVPQYTEFFIVLCIFNGAKCFRAIQIWEQFTYYAGIKS